MPTFRLSCRLECPETGCFAVWIDCMLASMQAGRLVSQTTFQLLRKSLASVRVARLRYVLTSTFLKLVETFSRPRCSDTVKKYKKRSFQENAVP
jgi:hypothetical protein